MPKFIIIAKNRGGSSETQVIEAPDKNAAIAKAQLAGMYVVRVESTDDSSRPASNVPPPPVKQFTHNNVKLADIVSFAKQMATMLEAGVPLLRSLSVIATQAESREFYRILHEVRDAVESGSPFSKSLAKHPKAFSSFWVSLVEVGEASGTMPRVLEKLTEYMEQAAKFQSQIIGALIYPAVLFTICTGAILVFALFVGPLFAKVFSDMKIPLPGLTVAMLGIFKFIQTKFFLIIGGAVGIGFLFKKYISTTVGRITFEKFLFALPVLGPVIKLIVIEKFASQMAILIESGVPILYALEIAERLVDNLVCGAVVQSIRESVKEGKLLADPMEKSGFFPPMAVQMIRVGEETGELGKMLNHIAKYYKDIVEEFMKRIGTLIEPVMLVFMGGIVGLIVISMFLPLITLATGGA